MGVVLHRGVGTSTIPSKLPPPVSNAAMSTFRLTGVSVAFPVHLYSWKLGDRPVFMGGPAMIKYSLALFRSILRIPRPPRSSSIGLPIVADALCPVTRSSTVATGADHPLLVVGAAS